MKPELRTKIQSWVDGELDEAEARRLASQVAADAEAATLATHLRTFSRLLRDHEPVRPVPESRDFYWSRIRLGVDRETRLAAGDAAASRGRTATPRWLTWLLPAAAVALFLFFALRPVTLPPSNGADRVSTMVGHVIETPLPELSTLTFYSARDAMTVVWVGSAEML